MNGGVWRTDNATSANPTWRPLTDKASSLSIGALALDPTDATGLTLVAGVGRWSNLGREGGNLTGILRTTDGGATWKLLDGGGVLAGKNVSGIAARGNTILVSVDMTDSGLLAEAGVYRSIDGGVTFTQISKTNGATTGLPGGKAYDLAADPTNNNVFYTSLVGGSTFGGQDGVFKSSNLGATWTKVSNALTMDTLIQTAGVSATSNIRIAVGLSNNVYVGIANGGQLAGVFRSGNGGQTWTPMDLPQTKEGPFFFGINPGAQADTNFSFCADPTNPNIVYIGGDRQPAPGADGVEGTADDGFPNSIGAADYTGRLFRGDASKAAGSQWVAITDLAVPATGAGTAHGSAPHADSRDMAFDAQGRLIEVDDGGIYVRTSPGDNTGDWFSLNNTLAVTEFHDVGYDSISNIIIGGARGTGVSEQVTPDGLTWREVSTGNGGAVAVVVDDLSLAGTNESYRYSSYQYLGGFERRVLDAQNNVVSTDYPALLVLGSGGKTFDTVDGGQFTTPIALNAIDPSRLVIGGATAVFESYDRGETLTKLAAGANANALVFGGYKGTVANPDVLWVATDNGVYLRTTAAGALAKTAYAGGAALDIAVDPADWTHVWVIEDSRIWFTTDSGNTWLDVTGNYDGAAGLRCVEAIAGGSAGTVVVGGVQGVYAMQATDPPTWVRLGSGLPNAPVYDMQYDSKDDVLVVGTLGRGVWTLSSAAANVFGWPILVSIIPNVGDVLMPGEVLHVAPQELTFRFNEGQSIDPATLGGIQIVGSGHDGVFGNGNDIDVAFGYVHIGDRPNEVIVRFAEALPDDFYRITIAGAGTDRLLSIHGIPFNEGVDVTRDFRLDLGAEVVAVVPQPVTRNAAGQLQQARNQIEVYFNDDELDMGSAQNTQFYQLIVTNDTADTNDDIAYNPTTVSYDPIANKAVLTFANVVGGIAINDINTLLPAGKRAFRLRIGEAYQNISTSALTPAGDEGSSYDTAYVVGPLTGQSLIISGSIDPQPYDLAWPGGTGDPGHRDLPAQPDILIEDHYLDGVGAPDGTYGPSTFVYDFRDDYGKDAKGNTLHNMITAAQKQRVREIFELFSTYFGAQFIENYDLKPGETGSDFTIAVGDLAALGGQSGPGGVAGMAGGILAVMDNAENWGNSETGGSFFQTAMHEIMHLLGLGHSYDATPMTIMGSLDDPNVNATSENVFPGDVDLVDALRLFRPDSNDIDLYKFRIDTIGTVNAETIAERLNDSSTLNTTLTLFEEYTDSHGLLQRKVIARNDDYFSKDSSLQLELQPGTYYIGVTASGNDQYDPTIKDSGLGGLTKGPYQLRLDFKPVDTAHLTDTSGTAFDGDADGIPGGTYNFWFNGQAAGNKTLFVDKTALGGGDGSLLKPYNSIVTALTYAKSGDIVRIEGNNFANDDPANPATLTDNKAYEIGYNIRGNALADGGKMEIPKGVTVMIDAGAVFKLRQANIDLGSSAVGIDRSGGVLQVLGTPEHEVYLTSYHNENLGSDGEPTRQTAPAKGDWGGLVFRSDLDHAYNAANPLVPRTDSEAQGIFLNYVNHASISYGGGQFYVNSVRGIYDPIHMVETRVTATFNTITNSADAAMSADPNSFLESKIEGNVAGALYTTDYGRVGPVLHGNSLSNNSVNGILVRIRTDAGKSLDMLTVAARFDDRDIVHVIPENLIVAGTPGGALLERGTGRHIARLAIDPDVVVKLDGSRVEAQIGAQVIAEGTLGHPVIFTSLLNDRYGAGGTFDTTNDADMGVAAPGDWGGLYFAPAAHGSLDYTSVDYAGGITTIEGGFGQFEAVEIHQAKVRLTNSILEYNAGGSADDRNGRGTATAATVFVRGAQPVIAGNIIRNGTSPAISVDVNSLNSEVVPDWGRSTGGLDAFDAHADYYGPLVRENRLGENGMNGMVVRGGALTTESIWDDTDIVHIVLDQIVVPNLQTYGGLRLQSSETESLVVKLGDKAGSASGSAGFTATGTPLEIDDRIGGTVQIVGTASHPVVLTALADDTVGAGKDPAGQPQTDTDNATAAPQPGAWRSIKLDRYSNDRNVAVVNELEPVFGGDTDANGTTAIAEYLGQLAAADKGGDESLRLGFEIHGNIRADLPSDVDVYSFRATAGSEVWLDIDRTTYSLDTVLELVDADGQMIARSDNSVEETAKPSLLGGSGLPLQVDIGQSPDHYGTNPRDAGMRVVLPGSGGDSRLYYVKVYSAGGLTKGAYQLQVRLRQTQEFPGSTVRFADIRYATNGIEILGMPTHSPLIGETADVDQAAGGNNDSYQNAQYIGNLLGSDRSVLSVAGYLSGVNDVDWYKFDVQYEGIQMPDAKKSTWATTFDIDYADGMARPDTTIWVFDDTGTLVYIGEDSNVTDDRPDPNTGTSLTDLYRGTVGPLDPFIGPVQLNESATKSYYVAVTGQGMTADALQQALLRREPIDSIRRLVEDHIDSTDGSLIADQTTKSLDLQAVPFHLGDVILYVNTLSDLYTVDPLTGAYETDVTDTGNNFLPGAAANLGTTYGDIAMRNDGELYTLSSSGQYRRLDTGNAKNLLVDNPTGVATVFEAMAHGPIVANKPRDVYAVGNLADPNAQYTNNLLYHLDIDGKADGPAGVGGNTILPMARLQTGPSIQVPNATHATNATNDILDATTFTIVDAQGVSRTFEFDCGVDALLDPNAPASLRDGQTFMLDDGSGPKIFELDSGPVFIVGDGTTLTDGDKFTINDGARLVTFEFNSAQDNNVPTYDPANIEIRFTGTETTAAVVDLVVTAINGAVAKVPGFTVTATGYVTAGGQGRLCLVNDVIGTDINPGNPGTSISIDPATAYGVSPGNIAVPFEEIQTMAQLAGTIIATVQANLNIEASFARDRLTFYHATNADFPTAPGTVPIMTWRNGASGQPSKDGKADLTSWATVPFHAGDTWQTVIAAMKAAIDAASTPGSGFHAVATPTGDLLNIDYAQSVTITAPLMQVGIGPGGAITGIIFVQDPPDLHRQDVCGQ